MMNTNRPNITIGFLLIITLFGCQSAVKSDYPIHPVPFYQVELNDHFWSTRIETNRTVTIPFALTKISETGRMDNFLKASGRMEGAHVGKRYNDTDVYKVIEGIAYSLQTYPDPDLETYADSLIHEIALAQEPDGYLFTGRTIDPANPPPGSGTDRWKQLNSSHELYNSGHLYEAGVAYFEATGKRELLDVSIRNADLLLETFGPGKLENIPGHQEIELALVKLYRVTAKKEYLDLSRFFLLQRGGDHSFEPFPEGSPFNVYNGKEYMQDHLPVLDQTEAVGHAVRAAYMYTGMADYAALSGDSLFYHAVGRIWEDVVNHKLYLTGGIGARHTSEAFGDPFELPNLEAYTETCASIGNVFWNYRMFLSSGESKYLDVLERTLYNGLISGVSLSGDRFFYQNPLEAFGQYTRSEWFEVSCCPGNIVRFLPSLPGYIYASENNRLMVNLFVGSKTTLKVGKQEIGLSQDTEYPWNGKVMLTVNPKRDTDFELAIRIPGWAGGDAIPGTLYDFVGVQHRSVAITVNDKPVDHFEDQGFWVIDRRWKSGDRVSVVFDMPVEMVQADSRVIDDRGKIAFQRGPLVYCFESTDNPGIDVHTAMVNLTGELTTEFRPDLLGGVVTIQVPVVKGVGKKEGGYLIGIPYYAWSNRGFSDMAVWIKKQ